MNEEQFWSALEFRLDREFAGMRKKRRGSLWCDGLAPGIYWLTDDPPRIVGCAWVGYTHNTDEWQFTLFLPGPVSSREAIDWASLLPPDNVTRWIAFDEDRRILQIEPAAAVPDLD